MNFRNLENLPLLISFRAIADEGSVVGAAQRLGLTQSAVSKHLARLRDWLDDPLFIRTSAGMMPTPRATELMQGLEALLAQVDALTQKAHAEPAQFSGTFTISATDEVLAALLPQLLPTVSRSAPNLRLRTLPLAPDYTLHELETGAVNLVIGVNWHAPETLRQTRLFEDRFVVVLRADNPLAEAPLTLKAYAEARHLLVAPLGLANGAIDDLLRARGLSRRVVASVPSFSLVGSDLLCRTSVITLPQRVAHRLTQDAGLALRELPLPAPPIVYHALWHPRFDREPRLRWVLDQVQGMLTDRAVAPS